jgi:hypothetical protein
MAANEAVARGRILIVKSPWSESGNVQNSP